MINIVSEKNVINGSVVDKEEIENMLLLDKTRIYEVIRVMNNTPVFLREHFNRLNNSIRLAGIDYQIDYMDFLASINMLIQNNCLPDCNIRVSFSDCESKRLFMYFIKSFYPDKAYYSEGIHTITIYKHRENPNIKRNTVTYRDEIDNQLKIHNAFEAILVNDDNTISEGSKSNVFFVKDNELITANDYDVLLGVTRDKVIEIAQKLGINVIKRKIFIDELSSFNAAFITGTSNNVLPIKSIDNNILNSCNNNIIKKLMQEYERLIFN